MRVGLIAPPWIPVPPVAYGGTEAVIANLAKGLTARGHQVRLFTVASSTSPVERRHLFEEPVEPMGASVPEAAHVLAAYESLSDVDVIHDHTVLGPLVAGRAGICTPPVVTTNHGPFTSVTRAIYREAARTCAVVAISADQAARAGDVPITAVIHHGIDLDTYRPGDHVGDQLVFMGRMSPDKGVDRAVRIAQAAGRPLRIITKMRDPDEEDFFQHCVRPLLAEDLVPVELPLEERVLLLSSAVGTLDPITWPEPFGLVMAESLAVGTPVIGSPVGAAPEIITHGRTGFLCATDDEAVEAVGRLDEIDRAECRADAERRFSLQRMALDHERLYEWVLGDRAAPPPRSSEPPRARPLSTTAR